MRNDSANAALLSSSSAIRAIANRQRAERRLRGVQLLALHAEAERWFDAIAAETAKLRELNDCDNAG
jgi:hypothetical protein